MAQLNIRNLVWQTRYETTVKEEKTETYRFVSNPSLRFSFLRGDVEGLIRRGIKLEHSNHNAITEIILFYCYYGGNNPEGMIYELL